SRSVPPEALILEITESQPLSSSHVVIDLLREYRAQGIGLSLDDFGTGHASLEQLESLPLSEVKLDGSLIRDIDAHTDVELREVMTVARDRGVRVVAEGIETQEQLERAAALRCDRGQGYLLCRPRPRDDIDRVLQR
ncbi:MAG: EAL domain-containing protein, partial [Mycetocola sp.]